MITRMLAAYVLDIVAYSTINLLYCDRCMLLYEITPSAHPTCITFYVYNELK